MRNVDYTYTFNYTQSGVYDFFCEPHRDLGMLGQITVNDVELNNTTVETGIETKYDDVSNQNDSKINLNLLLAAGVCVFVMIYFRTRIDDIANI